jgi:SAM (Sterile alpha motif) domain-containing protein
MDLGGWLRSLGLGKYEAAFRENEIDETVLPSLTHETLKELGVAAVGHRLMPRSNMPRLAVGLRRFWFAGRMAASPGARPKNTEHSKGTAGGWRWDGSARQGCDEPAQRYRRPA